MDPGVTNAECLEFLETTGHPAPLHWHQWNIPGRKESYLLIFVVREDAQNCLRWVNMRDDRICGLSTTAQFGHAVLGGIASIPYLRGTLTTTCGLSEISGSATCRCTIWG